MKLIYKNTDAYHAAGSEVKVGDWLKVDDILYAVTYFREPHKPESEGKVTLTREVHEGQTTCFDREYYVSIIDAEWIEREDRGWKPEVNIAEQAIEQLATKPAKDLAIWGWHQLSKIYGELLFPDDGEYAEVDNRVAELHFLSALQFLQLAQNHLALCAEELEKDHA